MNRDSQVMGVIVEQQWKQKMLSAVDSSRNHIRSPLLSAATGMPSLGLPGYFCHLLRSTLSMAWFLLLTQDCPFVIISACTCPFLFYPLFNLSFLNFSSYY